MSGKNLNEHRERKEMDADMEDVTATDHEPAPEGEEPMEESEQNRRQGTRAAKEEYKRTSREGNKWTSTWGKET